MSAVIHTIAGWPDAARAAAEAVRALILEEAAETGAGPLTETLKWGEPAFLTEATKAGTTVRLAWKPKKRDVLQMLVHCQTSLIDDWRGHFPELAFEGNRALLLPLDASLPEAELRLCLRAALTYHRAKP
jgi:hypothetical protein